MNAHLNTIARISTAGPVLALYGELDHDTAPQLHSAVRQLVLQAGQQLTIDMAGITLCDSSGISALLAARNHALETRALFALAAVPHRTAYTFGIVGLDQVLRSYPTTDDAVEAWSRTTSASS